ncbi:hypothetical protein Lepto7376_1076 [[Leptolyngbya] sp. PCC 7376]|uniref:hypothetical protein n=1 Tax=[Leptolyngbya] sp. PCC 7376 TaxID=111781 RepID=UPI00029F26AD|nr:hypothetical protein [[Leptolyngbya] sp. PCC 7376]AFY37446.1 hypothetical protein Lepto7376_1076 [[Leptolyngbya] sp. PCC 7376]
MSLHPMFAKVFAPRATTSERAMSLQAIFHMAFSQRVITPEMEEALRSILWSRQFSKKEMESLALMTNMLESGEIVQLNA